MSANGLANIDLFDSGHDPFSPLGLAHKVSEDGGTWSLTIPGEAVPKLRPQLAVIRGRARAFTPKRTRDYESIVRETAIREWRRPIIAARPVFMRATFVLPIPRSWSQIKQHAALTGGLYPFGPKDVDNLLKSVTDGLNGIVYIDDALVVEAYTRKCYGPVPQVHVVVTW